MPDEEENELSILKGILGEVQDLNNQLARTDERSRMNRDNVEMLRTDRIEPLENRVESNDNRSRRNSLILGAALTALTLIVGSSITYAFTLL